MPTELEMWLLFGYFVSNVPNKKITTRKQKKNKQGIHTIQLGGGEVEIFRKIFAGGGQKVYFGGGFMLLVVGR